MNIDNGINIGNGNGNGIGNRPGRRRRRHDPGDRQRSAARADQIGNGSGDLGIGGRPGRRGQSGPARQGPRCQFQTDRRQPRGRARKGGQTAGRWRRRRRRFRRPRAKAIAWQGAEEAIGEARDQAGAELLEGNLRAKATTAKPAAKPSTKAKAPTARKPAAKAPAYKPSGGSRANAAGARGNASRAAAAAERGGRRG